MGDMGGMMVVNPEMPAMAPVQIDRSGRAAVSTALVGTFLPHGADATDEENAAYNMTKDSYNAAGPVGWDAFANGIAGALAVYDALDLECGNQALYSAETGYGLAGVLANDRLWVNLDSDSCGVYLAVEANVTGLLANSDCGGRRPADTGIDPTLSLLAVGAVEGIDDGAGPTDNVAHPGEFPWLAAPVQ
jgi:hypothetical protein